MFTRPKPSFGSSSLSIPGDRRNSTGVPNADANPVWSSLAATNVSTAGPLIARQSDDEAPEATSCACDCESYCKDVARRYADDHIHHPDWFGTGNPTKIPVTLLESTCQYAVDGSCGYICWVKARDEDSGTLFWIIVLMYGDDRFHVTTSTGFYDACSYDILCPGPGEMGMKLVPAGCKSPK